MTRGSNGLVNSQLKLYRRIQKAPRARRTPQRLCLCSSHLAPPRRPPQCRRRLVARARRGAAEAERRDREARAQEEAYWQAAEGPKSRSARRREEDAEKRAEAAARRAENRRLAELEQQQLAAAARRPDRKAARVGGPAVPKVTKAELARRREEERLRLQREADAAKKRQARTADEEEYERVVLVANTNRDDSVIEARSVEDAIAKMAIAAEPALPPDRHPERRLKVSYKKQSLQSSRKRNLV
nr:unnamed protein product [Digitaria exilis]